MTSASPTCPKCGRPISPSAAKGLCTHCLVSAIFDEANEEATESPLPAPALVSQRIGDYELVEEIGRGGMGVVFRARDLRLNREVALKLILTGKLASNLEVKRFRAEAESAAHLDHPNIVPIYEVGESEGCHYFAMKLVEGGSLAGAGRNLLDIRGGRQLQHGSDANASSHLRRSKGKNDLLISIATTLAKVARAVHFAHQHGILHRDLKPGNILLETNGEPLVTDFGLARRLGGASDLTLSGAVVGSPSYMAPEQAAGRSREVTTAADIYSLGAVMYHMLAGKPPFDGDTPLEVLRQVIEDEPAPPGELSSLPSHKLQVDNDVQTICLKCLQKDPSRRYHTAEALADDLDRWLKNEPILARPVGTAERVYKWTKRRPAAAGLLSVSAAALIGLMVLQFVHEGRLTQERDHARLLERRAETNEFLAINEARRAESNAYTARLNLYAADIYTAARFVEAGQVGPALALLNNQKPRPGGPDVRGFEWHWLRSRCSGDAARVLREHSRAVHTLAFSSDGRLMASGDNNEIKLWNTASWELVSSFPSPNQREVLEAKGAQGFALMERDPKKAFELLTGRTGLETEIAPSRPDMAHATQALAFSPDGETLASSGEKEYLKFWDVSKGLMRTWCSSKAADALFLPSGRIVAFGDNTRHGRNLNIVDPRTGKIVENLTTDCTGSAVSRNGRWLVTLANLRDITVWDVSNLVATARFRTPDPVHGRIAISSDGQRVAGGIYDREQVRIYYVSEGGRQVGTDALGSQVLALAFSPDDTRLALGMRDSTVRLQDGFTGAALRRFAGHQSEVLAVAWGPTGELLSAAQDTTIRLWDMAPAPSAPFLPRRFVNFVASTDSDQFAGVTDDKRIVLWDGRGAEARPLNNRPGFVPLAFLPAEGAILVSSPSKDDHTILEVWSLADGSTLRNAEIAEGGHILANPNGDRVVVWNPHYAVVCEAQTGRELARLEGGRLLFQGPAVFDGQRFVVQTFPPGVATWDVSTSRLMATLRLPDGVHSRSLAITRDGELAITGDTDQRIRVWDLRAGRLLRTLTGHGGAVQLVAVSPDGRTLASFAEDFLVKLWSLPTGRELLTMSRTAGFGRLLFSGDGRTLAAAHPWNGASAWHVREDHP